MPANSYQPYISIIAKLSSAIRQHYQQEQGYSRSLINSKMCQLIIKICSQYHKVKQFPQQLSMTEHSQQSLETINTKMMEIIASTLSNCEKLNRQSLLMQIVLILQQEHSIIMNNKQADEIKAQRIYQSLKPQYKTDAQSRILFQQIPSQQQSQKKQNNRYTTPQKKKLFKQLIKPKQSFIPRVVQKKPTRRNLFQNLGNPQLNYPEQYLDYKIRTKIDFDYGQQRQEQPNQRDMKSKFSRLLLAQQNQLQTNQFQSLSDDEEDGIIMDDQQEEDDSIFNSIIEKQLKTDTFQRFDASIKETLTKTKRLREYISRQINPESFSRQFDAYQ